MTVPALPTEVNDFLTQVQIYAGGTVVSLASCMGMVAGLMRVVGLREEGKKRYKDALVGMVMVITAPAIIGLIATLLKVFFPAVAIPAVTNTIIMTHKALKIFL